MAEDIGPSDLQRLQRAIVRANTALLPLESDFHYYNSFKSFKEPVQECLKSIKSMLQRLPGAGPEMEEALTDKDDAFECVTALLDDTLDRADAAVGAAKKAAKQAELAVNIPVGGLLGASTVAGESASAKKSKGPSKDASSFFAQQSGSTDRPQDRFEDAVDNSNSPFVHNFEHVGDLQGGEGDLPKHMTLQQSRLDAHAEKLNQGGLATPPSLQHPLAALLADLHYAPWQLEATPPQAPKALEDTPLSFVDTVAALERMVQHLSMAKEIAIDLEHHHYRSFQGFTCLIQMSTREEDFIVDPLALRAHLGAALTPIFANTKIVKVLHGADKDIQWLQRDFGIYMANMFDTGQASRVLEYPGHGLGYLLQHFCQVKTDKKYQLADWRVRPLSEELMLYARTDTHYLLYIYDRLKAELVNQGATVPPVLAVALPTSSPQGALGVTMERSKQLCLQMYEKEMFKETSYQNMTGQLVCTSEQLAVFAGLYAWRDRTARAEDESIGYVLSRNLLQKLAMQMPTTASKVRSFCNSRSAPVVLNHCTEVAQVVSASKQQAPLFAGKTPTTSSQLAETQSKTPAEALEMSHTEAPSHGFNSSAAAAIPPAPTATAATGVEDTAKAADDVTKPQVPGFSLSSSAVVEAAALQQHPSAEAEVSHVGAAPSLPSPIKARVLKPITLARGSSAFLGQPNRPALAQAPDGIQPSLLAQTGPISEAAPAGVSQPVASDQAAAIRQPALATQSQKGDHQQPMGEPMTSTAAAAAEAASHAIHSMTAPQEQTTHVLGSSTRQPSAMGSAFAKQPRVIPQIRAAGSGAFGSQPTRLVPSIFPQGTAIALPDGSGPSQMPDLAAVNRLRAQFTLPFATAPAEEPAPVAKAGKRQQPEGQQLPTDKTSEGPGTADGIRAVVDALHAESPSGAAADAAAQSSSKRRKGSGEEPWHNQDFLPLPMSESYKLPSRRNRSKPENPQHRENMLSHDKPGRWAHDKHDQDDPADDANKSAAHLNLRGKSAHVQKALQDTGLDSSGSEEEGEQELEQQSKRRRGGKSKSDLIDSEQDMGELAQKQGKGGGANNNRAGAGAAQQGVSGSNPFGALVRHKDSGHSSRKHGRNQETDGTTADGAITAEATGHIPVQPFDYASARAKAPGLELGLNAASGAGRRGRGRGGGGRDSGGRGRGRGNQKEEPKPSPAGAFNPYGVTDDNWLKGGKRSAVNPRSGNRSKTFAGQ